MEQAAFLTLTLLGTAAIIGAMFRARLNWRADIPPCGRGTRSWDVLMHPERYAEPHAVTIIRALFLTGLVGIGGGLVILTREALHDFGHSIIR